MAEIRKPLDLDLFPTFFVKSWLEQSDQFGWNFHESGIRNFTIRLTGGCELSDEHAAGLKNLEDALGGRVNGRRSRKLPQVGGYVLFGGTRYLRVADPGRPIPGITEVLPAIQHQCVNARFVGVVAKDIRKMRYAMPYGLVVHRSDKPKGWKQGDVFDEKFTVVHPQAKSIMLVQQTVDKVSSEPWKDEANECFNICMQAKESGFGTLLIAYNGGGVTGDEIDKWLDAGLPVLIIKGSGRKCDELAANEHYLKSYPNLHVAENDVESIRSKLMSLGALTPEGK